MDKTDKFIINKKDYLKIRKLASNIYSRLLVIDCYCTIQNNDIKHILPILENLITDSDMLNAYFLDVPDSGVLG